MRVGLGIEIVEEGEHLCGVPAGTEDYEEVGWGAAFSGGWGARVEGGEGLDEAEL